MTYEEFKQLAEHPQHRDVPAIFKLEVLENGRAGGEEAFTLSEIQGEHLLSASFHHNFGGGRETDAPGCPLPQEDEGGRRLSAGYLLLLYLGDSNGTVALRPGMSFGKGV